MPLFKSLRHFARQRDPFREGRLLRFANGPDETGPGPDETPKSPDVNPDSTNVSNNRDDTRWNMAEVLRMDRMPNPDGTINRPPSMADILGMDRMPNERETQTSEGDGETHAGPERLNAEAVKARIERMLERMHGAYRTMQSLTLKLRAFGDRIPKEMRESWRDTEEKLNGQLTFTTGILEEVTFLTDWANTKITPQEFVEWLNEMHEVDFNEPDMEMIAMHHAARKFIDDTAGKTGGDLTGNEIPDITSADKWETLNPSTQETVVNELGGIGFVPEKLRFYNDHAAALERSFDKLHDALLQMSSRQTSSAGAAAPSQKAEDGKGKDDEKKKNADEDETKTPKIEFKEEPRDDGKLQKQESPVIDEKSKDDHERHTHKAAVLDILGIDFYSINQVIAAGKEWHETWTHEIKHHDRVKATRLAKQIGKTARFIPFGANTERALDVKVEGENDKEKKEYAEFLKDRGVSFKAVFGKNGELDRNEHHSNKAMGVLEYAASRGWLYKLNDQEGKKLDDIEIFGRNFRHFLPPDWEETRCMDYYRGLTTKNQKGGDEERDKLKKREAVHDDERPLVIAFEREMKNCNFWGAIGVMQAAMDRGKAGHMSGWLATIFMRQLRDNPEVRKYIHGTQIENMGFHTFNKTPFTLSNLAIDKSEIVNWIRKGKEGDKKELTLEAGVLAEIIGKIEKTVLERAGDEMSEYDLNNTIGKVLGAQNVTLPNGTTISIFEKDFEDYRNSNPLFNYYDEVNIGKEQADYYSTVSEVLLVPADIIASIFKVDSVGDMPNNKKAMLLTGNILSLYEKLLETDPAAARTLREEIGPKIANGIKGLLTANGLQKLVDTRYFRLVKQRNGKEVMVPQDPFIATLYKWGFIDDQFFKNVIERLKEPGKGFFNVVKQQAEGIRPPKLSEKSSVQAADKDVPGSPPRSGHSHGKHLSA